MRNSVVKMKVEKRMMEPNRLLRVEKNVDGMRLQQRCYQALENLSPSVSAPISIPM